jgi:hypothetical protein
MKQPHPYSIGTGLADQCAYLPEQLGMLAQFVHGDSPALTWSMRSVFPPEGVKLHYHERALSDRKQLA